MSGMLAAWSVTSVGFVVLMLVRHFRDRPAADTSGPEILPPSGIQCAWMASPP